MSRQKLHFVCKVVTFLISTAVALFVTSLTVAFLKNHHWFSLHLEIGNLNLSKAGMGINLSGNLTLFNSASYFIVFLFNLGNFNYWKNQNFSKKVLENVWRTMFYSLLTSVIAIICSSVIGILIPPIMLLVSSIAVIAFIVLFCIVLGAGLVPPIMNQFK